MANVSTAERWLVVNADDLGLSESVNAGVVHAARHGIVTSASLMVRGTAAADAARAVRALPGLSIGLHFDVAEWVHDGAVWRALYERVDSANEDDVANELASQLRLFAELIGRPPTHLDSHQHVHRNEPARSLVAAAGAALGVPVRGQSSQIGYRGDFFGQSSTGGPYRQAITVDALCAIIATLPVGLTELGCHPGFSDHLDSVYALEREVEARVLCAPEVLDAVRQSGVRLVSMSSVGGLGASEHQLQRVDHLDLGVPQDL